MWTLTAAQRAIYCRYSDLALPRHTSYPISPVWKNTYGATEFHEDLQRETDAELSLYIHVPFCRKLCFYCACTKEIVPDEKREKSDPADAFLAGVETEIRRFEPILKNRRVRQLHWGGGSPTFLTTPQIERLANLLASAFDFDADAERAIEIDPRITSEEQLEALKKLGFNRISLGIQDFDPGVQKAVNRLQSFERVAEVVANCRRLDFDSVNFDLIYGLPFQTRETLDRSLKQTLDLQPDRIAFYRLAVIPEIFRWQNVFRHTDLPSGEVSLDLNLQAIAFFENAGYEFIGLDHFAKPSEGLAKARDDGTLQRNFQGMTTGKGLDLVGIGPSAITLLDRAYAQNLKSTEEWLPRTLTEFPIERGLRLSEDDRIRREVLQQLYGIGVVGRASIASTFGIDFDSYFTSELARLKDLEDEGLVQIDTDAIRLTTPLGRLLVRVVASIFDHYLPANAYREGIPATLASKVG